MKFFAAIFFAAFNLSAQANDLAATNAGAAMPEPGQPASGVQSAEQIRTECIQDQRIICGKILKVLPRGLVVESGYSDLLRVPLTDSWLIPGSVTASRPANAIESREPGAACLGVVYLTDIPKSRGSGPKPRQYDYVVLQGYPTGQYTYTSVGTLQKTVRRFSASLTKAVNLNFESAKKAGVDSPAQVK